MAIRLFSIGLVLALAAVALGQEARWYALTLGDVPAGWRSDVEETTDDRLIWTTTEFLRINRGGQQVEIEAATTWVTDPQGRPIEIRTRQVLSGAPNETTWRFTKDAIEITAAQGGTTNTIRVPLPTTPWLTPQAARQLIAQRGDAGATTITYTTIAPELGVDVVQQSMERIGDTTVHWQGRDVKCTRWSTKTQGLPFESEATLSTDWRPVAGAMHLPFGELRYVLAGPQVTSLAGDAPELFTSLFVEPITALSRVHQRDQLLLQLTTKNGDDIDLASSGAQSIAGRGPGRITVLVDPSAPLPVKGGDVDDPDYRTSSTLIDSAHPDVLALVHKAVPERDANWPRRAEAMRDFVRRWVRSKGLSTAFASASETARSREGDCSEHAVLLAAMLRADGIPSRVATGLVWIDWANAFGWHMWTQAMLDGRWVDLDATLPMAYSPGHVLVSTSALADGDGQGELVGLLGLLGNVDIDVVEPGP
ncbi:MAG: transglutaminase-like domain-containing protein [Phycisphaerales bacterium]|nr:transglutaminase-like domain-containing protein [Phycisphaerales bacterium]